MLEREWDCCESVGLAAHCGDCAETLARAPLEWAESRREWAEGVGWAWGWAWSWVISWCTLCAWLELIM